MDLNILCQKLEHYGVTGTALKILNSYISDRTQIVAINEVSSEFRNISMGVPQGSILGPLLFVIYINDINRIGVDCELFLYADDTVIFLRKKDADTLQRALDTALPMVSEWLNINLLSLNTKKTVYQNYSNHKISSDFNVQINGVNIEHMETVLYLGVYIDTNLKFSTHINKTVNIISRNIGMISRVKCFLTEKLLAQLYNALVLPYINYCCFIWGTNYDNHLRPILLLQKRAMRIIGGIFLPSSANPIFYKHNILKVQDIAKMQTILLMHKSYLNEMPTSVCALFQIRMNITHNTRHDEHFIRPFSTKRYRLFTVAHQGPRLWNEIVARNYTRDQIPGSKLTLKRFLKTHFINPYI